MCPPEVSNESRNRSHMFRFIQFLSGEKREHEEGETQRFKIDSAGNAERGQEKADERSEDQ